MNKLFCKHNWETPIYKNSMSHVIMAQAFLRRKYICTKCGKTKMK